MAESLADDEDNISTWGRVNVNTLFADNIDELLERRMSSKDWMIVLKKKHAKIYKHVNRAREDNTYYKQPR